MESINNNLIEARKSTYHKMMESEFRLYRASSQADKIVFNPDLLSKLGLKKHDCIMFAFNRAKRTGYLWKESPAKDNYKLCVYDKRVNDSSLVISTKQLRQFFNNTFEIEEERTTYYKIDTIPDSKKRFKFYRINYHRSHKLAS